MFGAGNSPDYTYGELVHFNTLPLGYLTRKPVDAQQLGDICAI